MSILKSAILVNWNYISKGLPVTLLSEPNSNAVSRLGIDIWCEFKFKEHGDAWRIDNCKNLEINREKIYIFKNRQIKKIIKKKLITFTYFNETILLLLLLLIRRTRCKRMRRYKN